MRALASMVAAAMALAAGCTAEVQTSRVRWNPPARACRATAAEPRFGSCMVGPDNTANTFVVQLYRHPDPDIEEGGCLQCNQSEVCELVSTTCRCSPDVQGLDAYGDALGGLRLGELEPRGTYCVTVASLYVEGHARSDVGSCPASFVCEGALEPARGLVESAVRACSASFWADFPGELEMSRHICRDDPDPSPVRPSPNIAGCLGIPRLCQ